MTFPCPASRSVRFRSCVSEGLWGLFFLLLLLARPGALEAQVYWAVSWQRGENFSVHEGEWQQVVMAEPSPEGFLHVFAEAGSLGLAGISPAQGVPEAPDGRLGVHLLVTLRLGMDHAASQLRVGLRSLGGGRIQWDLPLADFNRGTFTTLALPWNAGTLAGDFSLAHLDLVFLESANPENGRIDFHLERVALAELPPTGTLRIVGPATSADPPHALYYHTLQSAVDAARPRDIILVQPGTYHESVTLRKDYGMAETRLRMVASRLGPVILEGRAGMNAEGDLTGIRFGFDWTADRQAVIRANHLEIDGFIVRDFVVMGFGNINPGRITIRNCLIHSNGQAGIGLNYVSSDTRILAYDNLVFCNGWGVGWAGGIHLNNKEGRLHSITRDQFDQSLPEDVDYGHEVIGNVSFLNLDESHYNSDGNGIMIDYAGGSEALVTDNIVFFNAGAGLRNLNGRVAFERNLVYRNGWDHRHTHTSGNAAGLGRSNNEQIGLIIRHNTDLFPQDLRTFLDFTYPEFIRTTLLNNIVWTASRFNLNGPYFSYTDGEQQRRSLSQFALEAGIWSLFRGDQPAPETSPATDHPQRQQQFGDRLTLSGGNRVTDDDHDLIDPNKPSQRLRSQLRQNDLHTFFTPAQHPFLLLPGADYVPPAYSHIFGQALHDAAGKVIPLSEDTRNTGIVEDPSFLRYLSSRHEQVAEPGNRPPLDLTAVDFTFREGIPSEFLEHRPEIYWDPARAGIYLEYLRDAFPDTSGLDDFPFAWQTWQASYNDDLGPFMEMADSLSWLEAEDFYASRTQNDPVRGARWQIVLHDPARFGSPYLQAREQAPSSLPDLDTALRIPFQLSQESAPLILFRIATPGPDIAQAGAFFLRVANGPQPLDLAATTVRQNPPAVDLQVPRLAAVDPVAGWYRVYLQHDPAGSLLLSLRLPWIPEGDYELQLQPLRENLLLDQCGIFTPQTGASGLHPARGPGPQWVLADWLRASLPPELSAQPAFQEPGGDPAGTGRPLLLSYALDLPPDKPAAPAPTSLQWAEIDGGVHPLLVFSQPPGRTDLEYRVEFSHDLQHWVHGAAHLDSWSQSTLEGWTQHQVRSRMPVTPASPGFLRLRVILRP